MNKEIDWNNIDWQGFFNLGHGIDLDGHKEDGLMLMIKAFVVETALPVFTNHQLKYVNEIGCEYVGIDGLRYELKCKKNLRTKTLGHTSPVVLKNNRGNGQHLIKTFDYMLAIDTTENYVYKCAWEDLIIEDWSGADIKCRVPQKNSIGSAFFTQKRQYPLIRDLTNLVESYAEQEAA